MFQLMGAPLVENCMTVFNISIFAYGQTGFGKYLYARPKHCWFESISINQQGLTPQVSVSVSLFLFLRFTMNRLQIYWILIKKIFREDAKSGIYVENLTEESLCTMSESSYGLRLYYCSLPCSGDSLLLIVVEVQNDVSINFMISGSLCPFLLPGISANEATTQRQG
ncbi:kinesin-like protein KIN-12B [Morus notabilis]|uniref:kinesin-like protein KIN-12B n=1 Tax=Morus notabilis TaxID=981085 RepID=UPI000CECED2A|nr:kinesin-like protein KIN-12B [Morus notabilis]